MIKKFKTINNFAVFKNYEWDKSCRDKGNNIVEFKKLNILYGRNYSGKTVLSRIVRSLEKKELSDRYNKVEFELATGTDNYNQSNIASNRLDVRVYNSDFVNDNLDFLKQDDGEVQSFAIVGEQNIQIKEKIEGKQKELGSEGEKTGLRHRFSLEKEKLESKIQEIKSKEESLDNKLQEKAREIKENTEIYDNVNYNIRCIKKDIETIEESSFASLANDLIDEKQNLIRETSKAEITNLLAFPNQLEDLEKIHKESTELLEREIKPTKSIQGLLDNTELQGWVEEGIKHHENKHNKRNECAFCGQNIPSDLWQKLDAHFNQDSRELKESLAAQIEKNKNLKINLENLNLPKKEEFYSQYQSDFQSTKDEIKEEIEQYNKFLEKIRETLEKRVKDIFTQLTNVEIEDNNQAIDKHIESIRKLMQGHNEMTNSLSIRQNKAGNELRLNEVFKFMNDIQYRKEQEKIYELEKEKINLEKECKKIESKVKELHREIDELLTQQQSEKIAVKKINEYLNHDFGIGNIKIALREKEENNGYRFEIKRGDHPAYNLSEGGKKHCSILLFPCETRRY